MIFKIKQIFNSKTTINIKVKEYIKSLKLFNNIAWLPFVTTTKINVIFLSSNVSTNTNITCT